MKAAVELGLRQVWLYAVYWLGLYSGYYRRMRPPSFGRPTVPAGNVELLHFQPPSAWTDVGQREPLCALLGEDGIRQALAEADRIAAGQVCLFGGPPVPLQLCPPGRLRHWADYQHDLAFGDIKFIWEPARFGWAVQLARAYRISADEAYAQVFWQRTETFLQANPPYLGPNWVSAQEVALRLMALAFAWYVFAGSPHSTAERCARLRLALVDHVARIPATLVYARAQNNNHLLSEAAALVTAGLLLADHPQAQRWQQLGRRWFSLGLRAQIDPDGAYIQHSANYHRLMLQLALWIAFLEANQSSESGTPAEPALPPAALSALGASIHWLLRLVDPTNGHAPNLGPNDGAYFLPLSGCPFDDYRPVLQAAARRFLGAPAFPPGPWDEMALWLAGDLMDVQHQPSTGDFRGEGLSGPYILRNPASDSWAYLRLAQFRSRPGHADQLHLDLWQRGLNLARDAGSYLYNASPPWDNALTHAAIHNTLTVNGLDQMQRAGRFLYLEWAQARVIETQALEHGFQKVVAEQDGYRRRLGVIHRRLVTARQDGSWLVEDWLLPAGKPRGPLAIHLHWLLPDWPWEIEGTSIRLISPLGPLILQVHPGSGFGMPYPAVEGALAVASLMRAGELLRGPGPAQPTWGWYSPTYGLKQPALSFSVYAAGAAPLSINSEWIFGKVQAD